VQLRPRSPRATAWSVSAIVVFILIGTGCGSANPGRIGATGVDELVIPTPDPSASDFVAEIDNAFLPLKSGTVWRYRISGVAGSETKTITVANDGKLVQGIDTTVVHEVVRDQDGEVVTDDYSWFAQDQRGNVWKFGERGSWQAGVGGGQAGLAMAAIPRVGDGYRKEFQPGVAEDRAAVLALDGTAKVEYGEFDDLVVIEETTPLDPGLIERRYYARGVGLVLVESRGTRTARMDLVDVTSP
jgi:hypothetical protein